MRTACDDHGMKFETEMKTERMVLVKASDHAT